MKILFVSGAFLISGILILNTSIVPCSSAGCQQFLERFIFLFLFPGAFLLGLSGLISCLLRPEWSVSFAFYFLATVSLIIFSGFAIFSIFSGVGPY